MKSFLRNIAFATATAAMAVTAAPARANEVLDAHARLWDAVERAGVPIFINDSEECKDNWGGGAYYTNSQKRISAMLICQDNGKGAGTDNAVAWTPNDLDSLRHESHHVVQDCLAGGLSDGKMRTMFQGEQLKAIVSGSLSQEMIQTILKLYDEEDHLIELEAFSVAADVGPDAIANALDKYCL